MYKNGRQRVRVLGARPFRYVAPCSPMHNARTVFPNPNPGTLPSRLGLCVSLVFGVPPFLKMKKVYWGKVFQGGSYMTTKPTYGKFQRTTDGVTVCLAQPYACGLCDLFFHYSVHDVSHTLQVSFVFVCPWFCIDARGMFD